MGDLWEHLRHQVRRATTIQEGTGSLPFLKGISLSKRMDLTLSLRVVAVVLTSRTIATVNAIKGINKLNLHRETSHLLVGIATSGRMHHPLGEDQAGAQVVIHVDRLGTLHLTVHSEHISSQDLDQSHLSP